MAKQFNGELIHFGAIRFRVVGTGNLKLTLRSLQDAVIHFLIDIPMVTVTNREPTRLVNYIDQRGCLRLGTTAINEVFEISKIIVFVKPVATGYPG